MAVQFVDRVPTYPGRIKFTKEDGTVIYGVWERADNPSVEGTPLNAATFNAMQEGGGLSADTTLYVSKTGSNTTGDGTEGKPYASITKALSVLPRNLNGFNATIRVSAGSYVENVEVKYFYGGTVIFRSTGDNVTISSVSIFDSLVEFYGINITLNSSSTAGSSLYIEGGRLFSLNDISIMSPSIGIHVTNGGRLHMAGADASFSGNSYAVLVDNGGYATIGTLAGSAQILLEAEKGGQICYNTITATASVRLHSTASGGRIYSGVQTSIPNY